MSVKSEIESLQPMVRLLGSGWRMDCETDWPALQGTRPTGATVDNVVVARVTFSAAGSEKLGFARVFGDVDFRDEQRFPGANKQKLVDMILTIVRTHFYRETVRQDREP